MGISQFMEHQSLRIQSGIVRLLSPLVVSASLLMPAAGPAWAVDPVETHTLPELSTAEGEATQAITQAQASPTEDEMQPMPEIETGPPSNLIDLSGSPTALKVGLIAERGVTYLQGRIEPFRRYLQESLERPVEIVAFRNMQALMAAHTSKQIDYATYPASTFALAQASCGCLTPLVAPVSTQAPDGLYMLLVVRGESGIRDLAGMTGRSLVLSSQNGALPYYVGLNELLQSGLDPARDLASLYSKTNPADALAMLEKGEVDAALVWSTTQFNQSLFTNQGAIAAYQESKKGRRKKAPAQPDFLSIWRSRPIPSGPHAVHSDMPKQDRADLIKALTNMQKDDPDAYDAIERYHGAGFQRVTLDNYAPLIEVATAR